MEEKKKGFVERFKEVVEEQKIRDKAMLLINCPVCNKQVSKNAISCLGCGNPIKKEDFGTKMTETGQKITRIGCGLTFLIIILGLLFGLLL